MAAQQVGPCPPMCHGCHLFSFQGDAHHLPLSVQRQHFVLLAPQTGARSPVPMLVPAGVGVEEFPAGIDRAWTQTKVWPCVTDLPT